MSDTEDEVEGEEGEGQKKDILPSKPPSEVQIKLAEQGKYIARKFDLLFATTMKIEASIVDVHATIKSGQEMLMKEFNNNFTFLSNRVVTIEKELAEEKAAAEAARREALGLPPEEKDPLEEFNKIHQSIGNLVKSKPELVDQAVMKLQETMFALAPAGEAPLAAEAPPAVEEEAPA